MLKWGWFNGDVPAVWYYEMPDRMVELAELTVSCMRFIRDAAGSYPESRYVTGHEMGVHVVAYPCPIKGDGRDVAVFQLEIRHSQCPDRDYPWPVPVEAVDPEGHASGFYVTMSWRNPGDGMLHLSKRERVENWAHISNRVDVAYRSYLRMMETPT